MEGTKAEEDSVFSISKQMAYLYQGMGQGFFPIIEHRRVIKSWHKNGHWYTIHSKTNETIIVTPRLKASLRRTKPSH